MGTPKPKRAGILSDEKLNLLSQRMRKMSYYIRSEDLWHAVETAIHHREISRQRMNRICELEAELEELRGDQDANEPV